MTEAATSTLILLTSLVLTAQSTFTVYLMLYTWAQPERLAATRSPHTHLPPRISFTAILPARHEQGVIAQTIHRVWNADYPKELLEIVVVCERSDTETIAEARRAATGIGHPNVRVLTFSDGPINKPHGLNVALGESAHEVVTIFDAEDDVHPEIFRIINTIVQQDSSPAIVQAGVQLMDFQSRWYSVHNVLEYFFWFKSRLHFHGRAGMVPLGGNTVFIRRDLIETVGGWDEKCLTEDADIGIRLSALGEKIAITYDATHVTREETPPTLASFIKQRTRWNQGFLQVLRKGEWLRLPSWPQRLLAVYTLAYPFLQALVGMLWMIAFAMIFLLKVPVALAMLSFLPLYSLVLQFATNLVGIYEFGKVYELRVRAKDVAVFTIGFLPYQALLSLGALRAVYRDLRGRTTWEKTEHTGAHRRLENLRRTTNREETGRTGVGQHPDAGFPDCLEVLLDEAYAQLGVERGSVVVFDPKKNALSIQAARGLPQEVLCSMKLNVREGITGWVAANRAPIVVDGRELPPALRPPELRFGLGQPERLSSIVLPIEQDSSTVAMVSLSSTSYKLGHDELGWLKERADTLLTKWPTLTTAKLRQPSFSEGG